MDSYSIQFYDLLTRALGANDAKRLQGYLDEVMAVKYNSLQIDGFSWAPDMQLDFTYEQLMKESGINVMAQYVDLDSPAIPIGGEGVSIATGKIPRMKLVEYLNEDKIRKRLLLEQRFGNSGDRVVNSARNDLFVTLDKLIGGHTNSMTYQRHQMVSAAGVVLTDKNNPNGIRGVKFSANVPKENFIKPTTNARWWTNANLTSEGTSSNPIADLKAIVKKGGKGHFEVNASYMDSILNHSKIKTAIAMHLFPASEVTNVVGSLAVMSTDNLVNALGKIVGAPFKLIDSIVAVEKWDKEQKKLSRQTFDAFESNVIVFVPDGSLGEILTVEPISVGGTVSTFYGGRLMLTVDYDAVKKCQGFYTEMTSLVVPDKPQCMYYLYPYSA